MFEEKVTHQIYEKALKLLDDNPQGLRFSDLKFRIESSYPNFHPKTINGCVWKLPQKFPKQVYKPERGVFRLTKYYEN